MTDAGELKMLADLGIVSISLTTREPDSALGEDAINGNDVSAYGAFTRADGSTGKLAEVQFATDERDTVYRGDNGPAGWAAKLPDAHGYGHLTGGYQSFRVSANDNALAEENCGVR